MDIFNISLNNAPPAKMSTSSSLDPAQYYLTQQRDFAGVIRNLQMGRWVWIIWVGGM